MKDAIALSREIMNAHPDGVRSLFQRYGIGAKVTPRTIILASQAFGDEFVAELYKLHRGGKNYDGISSLGYSSGLIDYSSSLWDGASATQYDVSGNLLSGTSTQQIVSGQTESNGSFWDRFKGIFSDVAGIVNTGVNTYNAVKTGSTAQTTEQAQTQAQIEAQRYAMELQAQQEAAATKTRQYLIVGVILVVLVVAAVLIFRKRK